MTREERRQQLTEREKEMRVHKRRGEERKQGHIRGKESRKEQSQTRKKEGR